MFEYYGNIHVTCLITIIFKTSSPLKHDVYCSGVGHMSPGFRFLESLIFSPTTHFLQDFHLK